MASHPWPFLSSSRLVGLRSVALQVLVRHAFHMARDDSQGRTVGYGMSGLILSIMLRRLPGARSVPNIVFAPSDDDETRSAVDSQKHNHHCSVMAANTKMATAVQILCVIAYRRDRPSNAEIIARSLTTNPVVVRRMLKEMEHAGLVEIRPGKDGGVRLARDPADVTLEAIYKAVEEEATVFALRPPANLACPIDTRMGGLLAPIFGAADAAVEGALRKTTLAELVRQIA